MIRKIIHIDMDAYYASVEQRDNPSLRGKPIIVGGSPEKRGVVSTASYEARKYGIISAMPVKQALSLCPNLVIVKPNFEKYTKISKELYKLYKEYTDLVEPLSLDECYLDVTSNKKNISTATEIAVLLKKQIRNKFNLIASVGVATNKLLAKIGSEKDKPDGLFVIKPNQIDCFMKNLNVKEIWGVGKATLKKFEKLNIKTCEELQSFSILELVDKFGSFGEILYYFARGIDERKVIPFHERKSIGSEITFVNDTNDLDFITDSLLEQVIRVTEILKKNKIKAKTITLKIKYSNFESISRSKTLSYYCDEQNIIYETCKVLLDKTEIQERKIRLVGISTSNLNTFNHYSKQLNLAIFVE